MRSNISIFRFFDSLKVGDDGGKDLVGLIPQSGYATFSVLAIPHVLDATFIEVSGLVVCVSEILTIQIQRLQTFCSSHNPEPALKDIHLKPYSISLSSEDSFWIPGRRTDALYMLM